VVADRPRGVCMSNYPARLGIALAVRVVILNNPRASPSMQGSSLAIAVGAAANHEAFSAVAAISHNHYPHQALYAAKQAAAALTGWGARGLAIGRVPSIPRKTLRLTDSVQ